MNNTLMRRPSAVIRWAPSQRRAVIIERVVVHVVLIVICGSLLLPLYWMIITSLRPTQELFQYPPSLLLPDPRVLNYLDAMQTVPFLTYLRNSTLIAGCNVVGATVSAIIVAYGFAKLPWPGRNALFGILIATMFLPGAATLAPTYILFHDIGWVGTYLPLIVPSFFSSAFNVFLLRQFYRGIPESLSESARIDGASEWVILWRVIVPLSTPAIASVMIFTFIANWDDFLGPLIYLSRPDMYTLPVGLYSFIGIHGTLWNQLMAAALLFMIPMVIVFFFGQSAFVKGGIRTTGIKG